MDYGQEGISNKQLILAENKLTYEFVTRIFDIILSVIGMFGLLPLFVVIALCIKVDDPKGNIIFTQNRVGKDGEVFKMFKFRSMYSDAEQRLEDLLKYNEAKGAMFKIKDDPRVTNIGKFIRRTSIDELPQLMNVIRGEMSLVGPRPALPREVEQYSKYDKQRLLVTPGITGLWQISGRSSLTFQQMIELDLLFIENRKIKNYILILFKTIKVVFRFENAY